MQLGLQLPFYQPPISHAAHDCNQHRALSTSEHPSDKYIEKTIFYHEVSTAGQLLFTLKQLMYYSCTHMLWRLLKVFFRQVYYYLGVKVWKDVQELRRL